METIVTNQEELDLVDVNFDGVIKVTGDVQYISSKYPNAFIEVCELAQVVNIHGTAKGLDIYGLAQVVNVYGKFPFCNVKENSQLVNVYGDCDNLNTSDNGKIVNILF